MTKSIPVIDLFAGPGGLGEGFSSFQDSKNRSPFRVALSIEKDPLAHATLELRSFYRQFAGGRVPADYYRFLRGEIPRQHLFGENPQQARVASAESWRAELGTERLDVVQDRIKKSINRSGPWVLIGGPPCQAYSLAGRSRNKGIESYDPETDVRQTLYVEYLQIIADHKPEVFVMENVKGLLSATLSANRLVERIVDDLSNPLKAIRREGRTALGKGRELRYSVYPLALSEPLDPVGPESFLVYAERHGIPQARHRVFLIGVRQDLHRHIPGNLKEVRPVPATAVLAGLPRLRSAVVPDGSDQWLRVLRSARRAKWLDAVRSNGGAQVAHSVIATLDSLSAPKKGRGAEFVRYDCTVDYKKSWFLDNRIGGACNHSTRSHMAADLHRYLFVSCFGKVHGRSPQLKDFPKELLPKHNNIHMALKGSTYFADRFRVQIGDKPATTITSHLSKDGHYYIHPDPSQCRSLTVREAARLQTFPDNYFFCGDRTPQFVQVGNAVPPLLASQIASIVHDLIG
jgi:DNA (cytosine-5)-methyltransferase 1